MPNNIIPEPSLSLSKTEARRFMLAHHKLLPPRSLQRKSGILEYIRRVGCIQFDPINVVGRNPDLVLQSRIEGYRPQLLDELLYLDRVLWDGWDKVASIYMSQNRPYFARHRALMEERHSGADNPAMKIADLVVEEIRDRGALSSLEFKQTERLDWSWGRPSSIAKAALETLYAIGKLGVHHRVNNRRYFDLVERLLPEELLRMEDPNQTDERYQDWHVARRIGGMGMASHQSSDSWLGILGVKSPQRRASLSRLVDSGRVVAVSVEGLDGKPFFIRTADLPTLEALDVGGPETAEAAFIAPLDNLIWDRNMLRLIFDFEYIWEVYKPKAQRKYGYYVLPVLYGDQFIARFEPTFDKRSRILTINNWWWEDGIKIDESMGLALADCLKSFCDYLDAVQLIVSNDISQKKLMDWITLIDLKAG